jgi:hypothetical protein
MLQQKNAGQKNGGRMLQQKNAGQKNGGRMLQQKNAGQKNEDQRIVIAVFLPGIFLLSLVCVSVEAGFENAP